MALSPGLDIKRLEAVHYYVRDLERSRRFYTEQFGFEELGGSSEALTKAGNQRSLVFDAGACRVICSTPVGEGGRAHRYLRKHPDGVGSLIFEVADIQHTFSLLEARGGTPIGAAEEFALGAGSFRTFAITTPFGDTTFRFVERRDCTLPYPGFVFREPRASYENPLGFIGFDHVTSNFQTLKPAMLWLEHVLGFERFWEVAFHTDDVAEVAGHPGSGLRSEVYWDPVSGVKFANNEPYRPNFKASQINVFNEQHRGDGVQHIAIATADIVEAVRALRERGITFMPTPKRYYEQLPARLSQLGIGSLQEPLSELEAAGILVDGAGRGKYLLQIFLRESAAVHQDESAGPFFFELIERKGDAGFGAGNFRALFESIERTQAEGKA